MILNLKIYKYILLSFFGIIMILLASFKPVGFDRDSIAYYQASINGIFDVRWVEPTFSIISSINNNFFSSSSIGLFFMYVSIAILLKLYILPKLTKYVNSALFLYITSYFLILELTQIRAAVAVGFFLWGLHDIINENKKSFLFKILLAATFHYSALIYVLVYFININKISRLFWIFVPLFGFLLSFIFTPSIMNFFIPNFLIHKIGLYLDIAEKAPLINPYRIGLLIIYMYFLYYIKRFNDKRLILYIKIFGISLFMYYLFANIGAVFSVRFSGMFSVVIIFLLPSLFQIIKQKLFVIFFILLYGFINIYYLLFIQNTFDFKVLL